VDYDVIIIGGGPAGSSAAITLAQAGRRVLVLERDKFPRFHIGESLLPYNVPLFKKLKVWEKLEGGSFMPKRGAQFESGDGDRNLRVNFTDGIYTECPESLQVERSRFDHILLEHARECGADVRESSTVLEHAIASDGISVKVRGCDGVDTEERAAFLIDASGLGNFTANREGLREFYPGHRKVAIFSHFAGMDMPTGEHFGDIIIVRRRNSWCWLIPLSAEKTSVGLVVDAADFKASGQTPEQLFQTAVAGTPALQRRMVNATRLGDMRVLSDFSYRNGALVSPRLLRAGDAAGFIDPVFSSGVLLAMTGGHQGALCVHEAIQQGKSMTSAMRRYERNLWRNIGIYWEFIEKFYTDHFTQLFFERQDFLRLPSAVNAVLAGRTKLPFAAKWRLRLFFLLVWIQKYFPLAPRTEIKS
jgi:FADH2-dependent halogenase